MSTLLPRHADIAISEAHVGDAGEVMTLQRAAFLTDAQIYGDPFLPSLTQTAADISLQIMDPAVCFLVARRGHRLIGSVRAHIHGETSHIGRLMTAPDLQGQGIGSLLMDAVEAALSTPILELQTGTKSVANIGFYGSRGYELVDESKLDSGLGIVTMRKFKPAT